MGGAVVEVELVGEGFAADVELGAAGGDEQILIAIAVEVEPDGGHLFEAGGASHPCGALERAKWPWPSFR